MNIVEDIRSSIIKECLNSPMLVNDIANMEKYISESYSGRSLIELMQNADDARASRLFVKKILDKCYIVANDGRFFNENDLISLCRSGASTKKRKGSTIGYRGIGFKSVVNYSSRVHLISGEIKITFSKELTKDELNNAENVPLVRLPHIFNSNLYTDEINKLQKESYNTIFIFETKNSAIEDEIKKFDSSCLLFLNNLQSITFNIDGNIATFSFSKKKIETDINLIELNDENKTEEWLVINNNNENKVNVAFKYNDGKVIELNSNERVVHSFMPTNDKIDVSMKLNGDFSTDPSRTRIVNDEYTEEALEECSNLVVQKFMDIFTNKKDNYGLMKILSKLKKDPMSRLRGWNFNDKFEEVTIDKMKNFIRTSYPEVSGYYIQSSDMDDKDFENIMLKVNAYGIGKHDEKLIPGILELCKQLEFTKIPYKIILEAMKDIECSENTKVSTVVDIIENTRLGLDKETTNTIKSAKLFSLADGSTSLSANNTEEVVLNDKFEGAIRDKLSLPSELDRFAKKVGISLSGKTNKIETGIESIDTQDSVKFIKSDVIKKWRNAEINFGEVIASFDEVERVEDVSERNLGYDVLAILKNGKNRYYEVKSVDRLGESFCLTNNELTTASQYGDEYFLAIISQSNKEFSICFIQNPFKNLDLIKRVTRWEWLCNQYEGIVYKINLE